MNPTICDIDNITAVSEFLRYYNVQILCGDYKEIEKYADENTFVYFDPPYRPISNTSAFTSYTKSKFNDDDQKQLKMLCDRLNKKKCLIMLSNSDSMNSNPPDPFFDDLYEGFNIARVEAKRNINSKGNKRGKVTEILVTNYDK
jgi:DNA adenine methylase